LRWVVIVGAILAAGGLVAWWVTRRAPLVTRPDPVPASVLIRNVTVIDVVAGKASAGMDVVIEGATIARVVPHSTSETAALVIDGTGMTVIPGLIDVHCHLLGPASPPWRLALPDVDENLERHLYAGVTRVFDPAAETPDIFEVRREVNEEGRLGPVIHAAGPMFTATGGHPVPLIKQFAPWFLAGSMIDAMARQVDTEAQAVAALDALRPSSPDFIKIAMDRIPPDAPRLDNAVAAALIRAAKEHGLRTVAHIGTTQDALDAAKAGGAAWVHGVYRERIPDEAIAELAAFKIPMAPTLVVFESYGVLGRGEFPATDLEREMVPREVLDSRVHAPDDWTWGDSMEALLVVMGEQRQNALDNVRRLAAAGVVIMAGSDAQGGIIHGASLHHELALLAKAGLSPLEALRAATLHNARFLANTQDPPFGIVAAGKRADLVLLRKNPLEDIAAISTIEQVIAGGVPLTRHRRY
jgi:imidazolonepropionase-like amidohydrolase